MTLETDMDYAGLESWLKQNNTAESQILSYKPEETKTAAGAASIWGVTLMNSASAAVNLTLANGQQIGQKKVFVMTEASNSSTVTVAAHVTSSPEVFTFAQAADTLELMWNGTHWVTALNSGVQTL